MTDRALYPALDELTNALLAEDHLIPDQRRDLLGILAHYLRTKPEGPIRLNFICTHNSRRSHLAQVWAATAAAYFGHQNVITFSGGTEATACNPRTIAALERAGFRATTSGGSKKNPHYLINFAEDHPPLRCYSKTIDDPINPREDFAAIMTCSHADENCPFLPGAEMRLPLTYEDPKVADGTPSESSRYDERLREIGREILWAFSRIQK